MCRARCGRPPLEECPSHDDSQADARRTGGPLTSPPRRLAQKVTGRAEYVHNLRLPGMLTARWCAAPWRMAASSASIPALRASLRACLRVYTGEDSRRSSRSPITVPRSTTSQFWRSARCGMSANPSPSCLPRTRTSPNEAAQTGRGGVRGTAGGLRRSRSDEFEGRRSRSPEAGRHLSPISSICTARRHQHRARFPSANAVIPRRHSPAPAMCSSMNFIPSRSCIPRSSRWSPWPSRRVTGLTIHTASQSPSFVRMEISRLLGWPENKVRVKVPHLGGGFGAKLYIKLEALVAALALMTRRPVKWSLTMEEQFYTITQTCHHVPDQERASMTAGKITGAPLRRLLERRRLCRYRAARHPEIRLHRAGPLRHRERRDRIPTRSIRTGRLPARCVASASRNWSGHTKAIPT